MSSDLARASVSRNCPSPESGCVAASTYVPFDGERHRSDLAKVGIGNATMTLTYVSFRFQSRMENHTPYVYATMLLPWCYDGCRCTQLHSNACQEKKYDTCTIPYVYDTMLEMPFFWKPKEDGKKRTKHSPKQMLAAILSVIEENNSVRASAKTFNIDRKTLERYYNDDSDEMTEMDSDYSDPDNDLEDFEDLGLDDDCSVGDFVLVMGNHDEFLSRIKKTLYYGKLPMTERFSLPVSELASELFSEVKNGHSLDYLHLDEAATLSRNACVSPCSLVLALLYLERLKTCNPEYLRTVASSELFLVSMMVASKFLNDDGEEDEVFNDEWAASAGISVKDINQIEREFLQAIDWEVFVSEQAFWKQLCKVETNVALQEGKRRGWFSYTDLDQLLETVDLAALAQVVVVVRITHLEK
uniref:Protein CNPPD1 n=1 Tax=Timema californicum TaxID=61474 RepID=A0A7R9P642_TIMCA|nr:unnamed protein product [Timema californicum]